MPPDEILIKFSVSDDGSPVIERVNKKLGETQQKSKALVPGLESARKSLTGFVGDNAALLGVLAGVAAAVGKGFALWQKYAGEVRDVAIASGTTAEQASRLLQVMDDYQVTAQDVLTASRAMKEKGLVPTVDTLAKLSDQFLAIKDPAERLKFAQDNLGRSASAYYNVLTQGSKTILSNAAAVSKSLILTDKQIKQAEQERLAVDALSDAWQGFWVQLGAGVGKIILANDEHSKAIEILKEQGVVVARGVEQTDAYAAAIAQVRAQQESTTAATQEGTDATTNAMQAEKDRKEALEAMSHVFEGLLSSMFAIQSANDTYQNTIDDLNRSDDDLIHKKAELTIAHMREKKAGQETTEEYNDYLKKLHEINQSIDENIKKRADASKDLKKQADQRVFDLAQERLGADGIIDSGEFEYLQHIAVQKGLVSQAAADQAIAESRAADDIVKGLGKTNDAMADTLELMMNIRANGGMVPFGVNFQNSGNTYGTNGVNYSSSFGSGQSSPMSVPLSSHDYMGPGNADSPYLVGVGAQPEVFIPKTDGMFYPKGKGLGNNNYFNITIGSIRSQQDIDYLAQEVTRLQAAR